MKEKQAWENPDFDDNPEWTEEDFAKAKPLSEFPELAAPLPKSKGGRPHGSNKALREAVEGKRI